MGRLPWIALVLAFSFGFYGLAKKLAGVDAIASLTVEMLVLTPIALAYIGWLWAHDELAFGSYGWGHALLMVGAGPVTALPLLFFGFAAHRVPLSVLGPLQYIAPVPAADHRRVAVQRADVGAAVARVRGRLDRPGGVHPRCPAQLAFPPAGAGRGPVGPQIAAWAARVESGRRDSRGDDRKRDD